MGHGYGGTGEETEVVQVARRGRRPVRGPHEKNYGSMQADPAHPALATNTGETLPARRRDGP